MEIAFWFAIILLVYPYVGYPIVIRLLSRFFPLREEVSIHEVDLPVVTLIISAYNEAAHIGEKLQNASSLDYPRQRLEILVVSDASTDATDEIIREIAVQDPRVRLLRRSERRGKSAGLNEAVVGAKGSIIVFSDANAIYRLDAIKELVRGFADPKVGYVVGAALYAKADSDAAASEDAYWNMEIGLKVAESRFCSVVGGDGAIYAIRRELFWDFKDDDISDFANPLQIVAHGFRGVFNPRAVCFEEAGDAFKKEFNRRRRIVNRSFRATIRYGRKLSITRHGRFLFALLSHKVLRWFTLLSLGVATGLNIALVALATSIVYAVTLTAIGGTLLLAGIGALYANVGWRSPRFVHLAYYFYLSAWAALLGVWDELRGVHHTTWNHIRQRT